MACEKDEEGLGGRGGCGGVRANVQHSVDYESTLCLHLRVRHIKGQRSEQTMSNNGPWQEFILARRPVSVT